MHNIPFAEMIAASAASPAFFSPYVYNSDVYVSGDHAARSPAMFSYLQE